jgi:hypothetical protein
MWSNTLSCDILRQLPTATAIARTALPNNSCMCHVTCYIADYDKVELANMDWLFSMALPTHVCVM